MQHQELSAMTVLPSLRCIIYILQKDGQEGEYVPDGNVNLQVTITYDTPPDGWSKVNWVGHYKKKKWLSAKNQCLMEIQLQLV